MILFPVFVDVYHNEQLVTKNKAEKAASNVWSLVEVAVTKDVNTAARIVDILDKYGFDYVARCIRGKSV